MQKPIKQEVVEWKQHKVTKYLMHHLKEDIELIKDIWANGQYTTESEGGTIQLNSQALGGVRALNSTLDFLESDMDSSEEKVEYEH